MDEDTCGCSINGNCGDKHADTINLPDGEIIPLITDHKPLSPAHSWRDRTRAVLDEILDILEKKQDFGYFDSIIDVQTDALLIEKAMRKYVLEHNKRWCERNNANMDKQMVDMLSTTKEELDKCNRGGYTVEYEKRMERLLL